MTVGEIILEILKFILPGAFVMGGVWMALKAFADKEVRKDRYEIRSMAFSKIMPLRLQAYERTILFLERISPENLVLRVSPGKMDIKTYHHILLNEIRSEYEHNMSQQLYISNEGWFAIMTAKERVVALINESSRELGGNGSGPHLGKRIIEKMMTAGTSPSREGIDVLKGDIQKAFRLIP